MAEQSGGDSNPEVDCSLAGKWCNPRLGREWPRVIEAATSDHDTIGNDRCRWSEQFLGHDADDAPRIRFGIVLKHVAHHVSRRLRAVASPAHDDNRALVDDGARFKMAATIRKAGDRAP